MRKRIEITAEKYKEYLNMSYEQFRRATYRIAPDGIGDYQYCVSKERDSDKARLSYIDYLVNDKGYGL